MDTKATPIEKDVPVERPDGVWATLRFDRHGGYTPGLGPTGVYYAEHGAPYFPVESAVLIQHRSRARAEKAMRSWLKNADSE